MVTILNLAVIKTSLANQINLELDYLHHNFNTTMSLFNTPQQQQQQQQYQTNMNGIFTHTKAEAILQRIQKSVERHEMEITSLRCDADSYQTQLQNDLHTMNESLSNIKSQMNNLLQRIERIERIERN